MGLDPSANRSSSFWATLGKNYLQIAENTLPKLGQVASDALALRYGGQAPETNVTPGEEVSNTHKMTFWAIVVGLGVLILFGLTGMFGTKRG